MAKFSSNPADEIHSRQGKVAGQPPPVTKTALEKFSQLENTGPPTKPSSFNKPASFKPPLGMKPSLQDTSDKDPKPPPLKSSLVASKVAALVQAANQEANESHGVPRPLGPNTTEELKGDPKPAFPKPFENRLPGSTPPRNELKPPGFRPSFKLPHQEGEAKPVFPRGVRENVIVSSQENEPKPPFSKPPLRQKPSPHGAHHEEGSNKNAFVNRAPPGPAGLVKKAHSFQSTKDTEEKSNHGMDSTPTGPFPPLKPVGPQSHRTQALQKAFAQQDVEVRPSVAKSIHKLTQESSDSNLGAPPVSFPSLSRGSTIGLGPSHLEKEEKDKKGPKRKAMTPLFKLGPPPQKPNRPPVVDLEKYRKVNGENPKKAPSGDLPPPLPAFFPAAPTATSSLPPPAPPGSHPSTQAPVLPPRNIKPRSTTIPPEDDENYDDTEFDSGGTRKSDEKLSSDGEMYEDIENIRPTAKEDGRKKEKEERKKIDLEKKEQKEKEKKEQEIRKKFKLTGPIEVIHQARACTSFKGGKNDLSFKQGDQIEIIRITDNPEGKWLGRTRGSYGYIKTTMVEVDYDSLKRKPHPPRNVQSKQQDSDQEVYDDVGDQDSISRYVRVNGYRYSCFHLKLYIIGIKFSVSQDEATNDSWPRGLLKILKGKNNPKKSVRRGSN
ncbi:hypothetical protein JRQ81_012977 [Phrynocephalus forsythii]|uniref:SH3 domain-containing protein n=1 Tax=Phrynocephalus forsythii TaxID=171643 RepID=A0A9Q0Y085_9SAUR|nr:hypothetical protein JRQ81_012977 [Phrynocephalus forsythii]